LRNIRTRGESFNEVLGDHNNIHIIVADGHHFTDPVYLLDKATGSLQILRYLGVTGPSSKLRLRNNLPLSQDSIERSLSILSNLGLIDRHEQDSFPFAKIHSLSSRGELFVKSSFLEWTSILIKKI